MQKFAIKRLNEVIVFLVFVIGFISTFYYKQLIRDGAPWAFRLFHFKTWVLDEPFIRYSSTIVQTPAVIFAKLGATPEVVNWFYCFGYFFYPFLALYILRLYLKNRNKESFILPLYLSFSLTIIPSWAFANSISTEAIVIFWFLYAYIIVEKKPRFILLALLGVLLLLSYESAAVFYGLSFWILWREKKLNIKSSILLFSLTIIQALNLLLKVMPRDGHKYFETSISYSFKTPFWILIIYVFSAIFLLQLNNRKIRWGTIILGCFLSGWTIYEVFQLGTQKLWISSYNNRVWNIPVSFLILWFFYEAFRLKKLKDVVGMQLLTVICLLPGLYHETILGMASYRITHRVEKMIDRYQGCVVLSLEEQAKLRQTSFLPAWDFPYLSIVMQKDKKLTTVIVNDYEASNGKILCRVSEDKRFLEYSGKHTLHQIPLKGTYDFSKIVNGDL